MKSLRNPEPTMKLAKSAHWLTIGLMALTLGITGCIKKGQKLTSIPGMGPGAIGDDRPNQPRFPDAQPQPPTLPPVVQENYPQPPDDFDNPAKWTPNRDMFRDQTVYFEFDKAVVNPGEIGKLREVATRMKGFANHALKIEGHCDERGTEEYNRTLGDRRAQAVREFLIREGLNPATLPTITYGEDKPADPGHNDAAWRKNRRAELILLVPVR